MTGFEKIFRHDIRETTADVPRRTFVRRALSGYFAKRYLIQDAYADWQAARSVASAVKFNAVNHLAEHLETFTKQAEARGTKVFFASNGKQARDYVSALCREKGVRSIVKAKTMTGEEIHLNEALEHEGYRVVESDLGEFIVQLRKEAPYHFVFPCMHLKREEIRETFEKSIGGITSDEPEALTMVARRVLRQEFVKADLGISGGNFLVAETGQVSITENEGNARLTCALPRIHVALVGIEKVVPRFEDLALFLPMLGTAGAGQNLTGYNTLYSGPRQPGETDGPEEFHVILLDNHRTRLLADPEQRDALHCIRCGACLNVCPIFKNIGGHAYGTTYQGPIGSVITPHLRGLQDWKHLSSASSLCGACTETCPVKIDLHHHLLRNRRNAVKEQGTWWERLLFRGFGFAASHAGLFRLGSALAVPALKVQALFSGKWFDPAALWTKSRTLPPPPSKTFQQLWAEREAQKQKERK
ncbi:L-lactate dehydrogenase complex protein LldF [Verrucomicrobium sp. GAS474]|uniref:LutB/LldF family L-lactate oxidation iron-sulfur protein n=1 Tax=Verrucomicrobium sp. GAS474 TaxID=1882831 RepID=UPI00087C3134|nr:LutB/LldF family L-lactate oxidation iron-sulfur protein [Verrucomicrobium sp. GAS474]SDT85963.1 L-lactate dehydrogenase complex protein LldF [Verrucomicrobium sp. GAS474]